MSNSPLKTSLENEKKGIMAVSGITGFLGQALTKRLLDEGHEVRGLARNEKQIVEFRQEFPQVEVIIGDVANEAMVRKLMNGCDGIIHCAAQKDVRLAEKDVFSCCLSNVGGTMNVVKVSLETKPKFVMLISTDKAAQVNGIYGASKLISEGLFREAETINPDTKYRVVRYGNIWASSSSIGAVWPEKMRKGEEITITDPESSRFYWPIEDAVNHIFECLEKAKDSTPYTPEMKAVSLGTVVEAMQEVYGKCPVKIIELREGENKFESLDGITFSNNVPQFSKKEFISKFLQ